MEETFAAHRSEIIRFVREVLGCGCSDEVFKETRVEPGDSDGQYKIWIGGRLFVWIMHFPPSSANTLGKIAEEGKRARDEKKYNRFRLVLVAEHPKEVEPELARQFSALPNRDEKMHLHVVSPRDLPQALR